jgi:hypothetical protein
MSQSSQPEFLHYTIALTVVGLVAFLPLTAVNGWNGSGIAAELAGPGIAGCLLSILGAALLLFTIVGGIHAGLQGALWSTGAIAIALMLGMVLIDNFAVGAQRSLLHFVLLVVAATLVGIALLAVGRRRSPSAN